MTTAMARYQIGITLETVTPFLQSGLAQASHAFDETPLTDHHDRLIISGDQLEGYLLATMKAAAADATRIADWFGVEGKQFDGRKPSKNDSQGQFSRGALKIFDLVGNHAPAKWQPYHRVRVNDDTGAAKNGAYLVTAQPAAPAERFTFTGMARLFAKDEAEADLLVSWLNIAFELVPALGADKSAGFGKLTRLAAVRDGAAQALSTSASASTPMRAASLLLWFDHPFLVDVALRSGNVQIGSDIIPGHVLKGAIADMLAMTGELAAFSDLLSAATVRHAFPHRNARRPYVAPLSLGFADNVAMDWLEPPQGNAVPLFEMDWKDAHRDAVARCYHISNPGFAARTRTAVNSKTYAPVAEKLFSQLSVVPDNRHWASAILLPLDASDELQQQLGRLADMLTRCGIARIGKTAIPAAVKAAVLGEPQPLPADLVRLTLQTPALMFRADSLDASKGAINPEQLYKTYFSSKAPGAELKAYMARQRWAGGSRLLAKGRADYQPWLLTDACSVFLVSGIPHETLVEWARLGLAAAEPGITWQTCPFVRENGFGEVRLGKDDLQIIERVGRAA